MQKPESQFGVGHFLENRKQQRFLHLFPTTESIMGIYYLKIYPFKILFVYIDCGKERVSTNFMWCVILGEYKGHRLLESVKQTDVTLVKKQLSSEIINFKHPFTGDTALVSVEQEAICTILSSIKQHIYSTPAIQQFFRLIKLHTYSYLFLWYGKWRCFSLRESSNAAY